MAVNVWDVTPCIGGTLPNYGDTGSKFSRNVGNFKADSNNEAKYRL